MKLRHFFTGKDCQSALTQKKSMVRGKMKKNKLHSCVFRGSDGCITFLVVLEKGVKSGLRGKSEKIKSLPLTKWGSMRPRSSYPKHKV